MATRKIITFVDDIDGSTVNVMSVRFSIDGQHYEIDLNETHLREFHEALRRFTTAGRRVSATQGASTARRLTGGNSPVSRDYDPKVVRSWGSANGHDLPARGRVPTVVIEAYRQARRASA